MVGNSLFGTGSSKRGKGRKRFSLEPGEDDLQQNVIEWAQLVKYKNGRLANVIHHSPNGGKRSKSEGKKFKDMGTVAGFPDLLVCIGNSQYHALFIEMKSKKGRLRESQKAYHEMLREQGYKVVVCHSDLTAIKEISDYLLIA